MINYTKKDEDFHGIFKLVSGEEVLAKAVITEQDGDCLIFLQDPVCVHIITMGTMSKPIILMYEAFILGDDPTKIHRRKTKVDNSTGYLGKIEDARTMFEKLYDL